MQTDAATPNNTQQQATGCADGRNMVKSNNAELLANNVASVCRGGLVVSYSYFSFNAIRSRNTMKSLYILSCDRYFALLSSFFLLKLLGLLSLYNNHQPASTVS